MILRERTREGRCVCVVGRGGLMDDMEGEKGGGGGVGEVNKRKRGRNGIIFT